MKCPFCGSSDLKVIDKRQSDDESNRRRRECLKCNKRFTTYERVEMVEIKVEKKDGRRTDYTISDVRALFKKHKIDRKHYSAIYKAICGKNVIKLGLDDIKIIAKKAKKIRFYHLDVGELDDVKFGKNMKSNLKGMKNAILMITGSKSTTLDDLSFIWDSAIKCLPQDAKTCFSFKIGEGSELQIDVLAAK